MLYSVLRRGEEPAHRLVVGLEPGGDAAGHRQRGNGCAAPSHQELRCGTHEPAVRVHGAARPVVLQQQREDGRAIERAVRVDVDRPREDHLLERAGVDEGERRDHLLLPLARVGARLHGEARRRPRRRSGGGGARLLRSGRRDSRPPGAPVVGEADGGRGDQEHPAPGEPQRTRRERSGGGMGPGRVVLDGVEERGRALRCDSRRCAGGDEAHVVGEPRDAVGPQVLQEVGRPAGQVDLGGSRDEAPPLGDLGNCGRGHRSVPVISCAAPRPRSARRTSVKPLSRTRASRSEGGGRYSVDAGRYAYAARSERRPPTKGTTRRK